VADDDRPEAASPPPDGSSDETADRDQPPSKEEALHRLRTETSELSSIRFGKIVAEGTSRLAGITTVNVFNGAFSVAGDFVAAGGNRRRPAAGRGARTGVDLTAELKELEHFEPPPGFDDGVDVLVDRRLLVLSGPGNTGLRTRALASLREAMRQVEVEPQLVEVTGAVLGNPSWRVPHDRTGLLVVDRARKGGRFAAESVGDAWLDRIAERLDAQESFLVVVTGPVAGSLATASRRAEFVLDDLELPDPMGIVRRRVIGELAWDPADLDERLAGTELPELLSERDDPQFAVRAAAAVGKALRAGDDLVVTVARLRNTEEQVSEWLDREPDLADIAFVMATAVLEGASYLSVADAAVELYRQLSSSGGATTPRYLRELELERDWIDCPREPDGGITVRFKHARLRPVVLAAIWFQYDGARKKIVDWLRGLASHGDVEVRARAAQAAGILASNDFNHGLHRYLLPWAQTGSVRLQQSAATGLNIAAATGDQTAAAWTHIEQWADPAGGGKQRVSLRGTAGLAAGGSLGVGSPHRALRMLRTLVDKGGWELLDAVAVSTQSLLEAGLSREVLAALTEWADGSLADERVVRALTMFAFSVLPEGDTGEKPLLLAEADEHRDELPELWSRALASEPVRQLATDALEDWVRWVDADPSLRHTVLGVIADMADRTDSDYDRLCHLLHEWAMDPDDPSDAARDFYHELIEAGENVS
jgi:hypothetical protein